jgi:hypothetical protein
MEKKLKLAKSRKLPKYREIKETKLKPTQSNTKKSSIQLTKKFKIATKPRMRQERLTMKLCINLIYKTIKSDGLEVLETKRSILSLKVPIDRKELPRRERNLPMQPIQMRRKLKLVIILLNIATNLRCNKDLDNKQMIKLPRNLIQKCKMTT